MAIALISCPIFAAANTGYASATLNYTIDKAQKTAPSGLTKQDETIKGILFTLDDTQAFTKKNPSLMKTEYSCSPLETQNFMTTLNKISVGTTRHARAYAVLENGDIIYSTNIISNSLLGYSQIGSAEDEMED